MLHKFCSSAAILAGGMTSAFAQDAAPLPACDIIDEQAVYWEAIGETVTVRIELTGAAGTLPRGKTFMSFADGEEISVDEGGKYIDDFDADNPPSCADHLSAAKSPVIASLEGSPTYLWGVVPLRTMGDVSKVFKRAMQCAEEGWITEPEGAPEKVMTPLLKCDDVKYYADDVLVDNDFSSEVHQSLISKNAPLITVPYSTYGVTVYAFDAELRTLHPLSASGC